MNYPLLEISDSNKNLIAFVLCTAMLMFFNKIRDKKNDAKNAEVLRTTAETNATVKKVYKLTDGHLGTLKRNVAISAQTNANSLRLLANTLDDPDSKYADPADNAEREALAAKQEADEHDARLKQLDEEIKLRAAEVAASMPAEAAVKLADQISQAADAAHRTCDEIDKADATAAKVVEKVQEEKQP